MAINHTFSLVNMPIANKWDAPRLVRIYKVIHTDASDEFDDMYVGSTTMPLCQRLNGHRGSVIKSKSKFYQWMRDVGVHNVTIVLVEQHMCSSFEEQRMREREVQDRLKPSLNMVDAYVCREERMARDQERNMRYRLEHLEERREADRQYYQDNRDRLLTHAREYREEHKGRIAEVQKEYRQRQGDELKQKKKAYYEANRDAILQRNKEKQHANIEEVRAQARENYQKNRDKILARGMQKRRAEGAKPRVVYTEEERKAKRKEISTRYRENNKEKRGAAMAAWREKNQEHIAEYNAKRNEKRRAEYAEKRRKLNDVPM